MEWSFFVVLLVEIVLRLYDFMFRRVDIFSKRTVLEGDRSCLHHRPDELVEYILRSTFFQ